jgi:hypothetical protein
MVNLRGGLVAVSIVLSSGTSPLGVGAADVTSSAALGEALQILGRGVLGASEAAWSRIDPVSVARWEPGEWTYRITAGAHRGQMERERLAPIDVTTRGETWKRTIGQEYTLYLTQTPEGSLVLSSEVAHAHKALVYFEPPLSYLSAGLAPDETREFSCLMDVYRVGDLTTRWYSGRIRATTAYGGAHQVTTPAGTFRAVLIRTDYKIDILTVVSVTDTLYTFYAEGIGKVAEAEHRRISAMALFNSDTLTGKVLVSFTPASRPARPFHAPGGAETP